MGPDPAALSAAEPGAVGAPWVHAAMHLPVPSPEPPEPLLPGSYRAPTGLLPGWSYTLAAK